jgi:WD40 repeat protein
MAQWKVHSHSHWSHRVRKCDTPLSVRVSHFHLYSPVWSVDFSPNGLKLVSGSNDKSVRVWDSQSGECLLILTDHDRSDPFTLICSYFCWLLLVWSMQCDFHPMGLKYWVAHLTRQWNCLTVKQEIAKSLLRVIQGKRVNGIDLGEWTASLVVFICSPIGCVSFSFDGQTVLSGSRDTTIKIWSVGSGECLKTLTGHSS